MDNNINIFLIRHFSLDDHVFKTKTIYCMAKSAGNNI